MWQQAPLAAGTHQVQEAVEDRTQVGGRTSGGLALGQQRPQLCVLRIGQVGVVGCASHNPLCAADIGFLHRLLVAKQESIWT